MLRGIDHIVMPVRDLDAAVETYKGLGFTVTPKAEHPFGTGNAIVQLSNRTYLELLAILDPDRIAVGTESQFSFGAFNSKFLAEREGISMLAATSIDPVTEELEFAAAGAAIFDRVDFSRMATRPDGTEAEVSFSLAFGKHPNIPETAFFSCRHREPENFWAAEYQSHGNGATGIIGVVMVADDPADHHEFLSAFVGQREIRSTSMGVEIECKNSTISVMSAEAFTWRYGLEFAPRPNLFRAIRLSVADIKTTRDTLTKNGIGFEDRFGALVLPPEHAHGVSLIFE